MKKRQGSTRQWAVAAIASLATVISTSWIADGLNGQCLLGPVLGSCGDAPGALWPRIGLASVLFGIAITVLSRTAGGLLPARQLKSHNKVTGHRALIAGISPFLPNPQEVEGLWTISRTDQGVTQCVVLSGDLDADI